jgi:SnoaL-like domain
MSQENVAIVQAALAAWNARDMQALTELLDPYMVARMPEGWFEPISFGRDAVMRGWEEARGIWENDMLDPLSDFIDVGNRVALRFTWRGEGRLPTRTCSSPPSTRCETGGSPIRSRSGITQKLSRPWGCRSKTFMPTLKPAYCTGDVAQSRCAVK